MTPMHWPTAGLLPGTIPRNRRRGLFPERYRDLLPSAGGYPVRISFLVHSFWTANASDLPTLTPSLPRKRCPMTTANLQRDPLGLELNDRAERLPERFRRHG